jgi:eukaryotic-like serine/threonine-protein kinase
MTPERWQKIEELFEAVLELPVEERTTYLAHASAGDEELRHCVEVMLAADRQEDLEKDQPAKRIDRVLGTSNTAPDDAQRFIGEMIGVYQLIKELGRGGMGAVYLAYDTRLRRRVALKLLASHLVYSQERVRRFHREARTASALNHPNIITIYDFGNEDGRDYIASEFVEGRTLRNYLNDTDRSLTQILNLVIQVASALEAAHAAGIIHRDIKPENIMLRLDGYVKVLDFGLAKLSESDSGKNEIMMSMSENPDIETSAGTVLGTVYYMSPEQVLGQKVDWRSDLFSLGVILYELITGNRPFRGETWHHTMVAITDANPPPIAAGGQGAMVSLQKIIDRALAKNREQRYQSARALLTDLEAVKSELADDLRIQQINSERPRVATTIDEALHKIVPGKILKGAVAAIAIMSLAASTYFCFGWRLSRDAPALTEKDTILLTDFVNHTGDAVFDDTLKHGLMVQFEQSPYFNILSEEQARETLRLMERSPDEKILLNVGREICQRLGIKALLVGTIASLGRDYVITLEAINCQTGETIGQQQTEAEGKEQVLRALGRAATAMRKHLGESLASIHKYDAPIEQATTTSLEAFKDYNVGIELRRKGEYAQSVIPFKRALERDPGFAQAYLCLGNSYRDQRNLLLGNQYLERAYHLRDQVSERERLEITASYYMYITGEIDKGIATSVLLSETYPQESSGFNLHGNSLMSAGEFEQATKAYRAALRLDPEYPLSHANLALALIALNRPDEAQVVIEQGLARGLDSSGFHNRLYLIAFLKGNTQAQLSEAEWFAGKHDEYQIREIEARSAAFAGRWREAGMKFKLAGALAAGRGLLSEKARIMANEANLNAIFGLTQLASEQAALVLSLLDKNNITQEELASSLIQQLDYPPLAWTLALCGDAALAHSLSENYARKHLLDTIYNSVWLPLINATLELKRDSTASPDKAIQLLQPARQYEAAVFFKPIWMRGQAQLQAKNWDLAAAEFQKIIDHRGWDVVSPLWPLAHLGLARAAVLQGDVDRSRKAYGDFFRLWEGADADLPILIEAKKEYEKVGSRQ